MKTISNKTSFLNVIRLLFRNRLAESILVQFTNGKNWKNISARIPANYYQYKKGSVRSVERNGFSLVLDLSDYMQWLLYFGIETEPRNALYSLVKPGMTIVDVGANIGETSMMFSKLVKTHGHVYAFEPDPETYIHLQQHLELNNCKNVTSFPVALGNSEGNLFLEHNSHNTAGNRISEASGKKITISKADSYFTKLQLPKIDLLKIDIEGYELNMLLGARETILKYKPILFVEAVDEFLQHQGASTAELVSLLLSMNYTLFNAYDGIDIKPETKFEGTHFDIVAYPK